MEQIHLGKVESTVSYTVHTDRCSRLLLYKLFKILLHNRPRIEIKKKKQYTLQPQHPNLGHLAWNKIRGWPPPQKCERKQMWLLQQQLHQSTFTVDTILPGMVRDHSRGASHPLSSGRKTVHQGKPAFGLWYFSTVSGPHLDGRPFANSSNLSYTTTISCTMDTIRLGLG